MRRATWMVALCSSAALAYIPTIGSLLKRAATHPDEIDRGRDVTLKGALQIGQGGAMPASLTLHFPLRCRLSTSDATGRGQSPGAVSVRGQPGSAALNFKKREKSTVATSAMPIGRPGWPDLAVSTASKDSMRMALARLRISCWSGAARSGLDSGVGMGDFRQRGGGLSEGGLVPSRAGTMP